MKKALAILMAISLVMPLSSVKAIEGNYYVYTKGDEVNFYVNENDQKQGESTQDAGQTTLIIKDEGKDQEYVKVLATGYVVYNGDDIYTKDGFTYSENVSAKSAIKTIIGNVTNPTKTKNPIEPGYVKDLEGSVGFISLDELVDVFGAEKQSDGTYKINPDKTIGSYNKTIREAFSVTIEEMAATVTAQNLVYENKGDITRFATGFYTNTFADDGKIYAVDFELDDNDEIKGITVKPVALPRADAKAAGITEQFIYALMPTLYMNKTYDCHYTEPEPEVSYSCYLCDDEYIWSKDGEEGKECKVEEKITSKSKCVKPAPTGVSEYVAELIGVFGIAGIAYILVKRKDLFKTI